MIVFNPGLNVSTFAKTSAGMSDTTRCKRISGVLPTVSRTELRYFMLVFSKIVVKVLVLSPTNVAFDCLSNAIEKENDGFMAGDGIAFPRE